MVYEAFVGNSDCAVGYAGFMHGQSWSWIYNARLVESNFHYDDLTSFTSSWVYLLLECQKEMAVCNLYHATYVV
jgi:hypothetical protein